MRAPHSETGPDDSRGGAGAGRQGGRPDRALAEREIAAQRNKLLTLAEVASRLGTSKHSVYELMYRGELVSVQIPSESGRRSTRRIEQAEIDAFIARYRVKGGTTPGGVL